MRRRLGRLRRKVRHRLAKPLVAPGPRLVPAPVFVISSVRSGSTLLRVVLNSHPKIRAPHEMHLRALTVSIGREYAETSVEALGLDAEELEHLLWDRLLHRELQRSGKEMIVEKTPGNVLIWPRLQRAWPKARYVFLLRHPASMVSSLISGRPDRDYDQTVREVYGYVKNVHEARESLQGHTVWYEELTAEPERVTKELCAFLGVPWDRRMLDYGRHDHGPYKGGIGDWSSNIKSGKVNAAKPLPPAEEVPELLRDIAKAWGYDA